MIKKSKKRHIGRKPWVLKKVMIMVSFFSNLNKEEFLANFMIFKNASFRINVF